MNRKKNFESGPKKGQLWWRLYIIRRGQPDKLVATVRAETKAKAIALAERANGYLKQYSLKGVSFIRNPRQPHRRVRKALKKYVKQELAGLPTQYTPAQVRVDSKGEIDIKFARPPKGSVRNPKRFKVTRKR